MEKTTDGDGWRYYGTKISVTTILSNTIANPKLSEWYKNNTVKKIETVRSTTASFGTEAHKYFEKLLLNENCEPAAEHRIHVNNFNKWREAHDVKALHVEKTLESDSKGFAGTCDFIGFIDGKVYIADWKTSRRYNITNGYQLGAYRLAAIEMGLVDDSCGIMGVQIDRNTAEIKTFEYEHIDFVEDAFLNTLDLFKAVYFHKLKKLEWPWLLTKTMKRI